jgi:hypothetical protein
MRCGEKTMKDDASVGFGIYTLNYRKLLNRIVQGTLYLHKSALKYFADSNSLKYRSFSGSPARRLEHPGDGFAMPD